MTLSWAGAAPVGDCMADRLNDDMALRSVWQQKVKVKEEGRAISFDFGIFSGDYDEAFLPWIYTGEVTSQGEVEASYQPLGVGVFMDVSSGGVRPRCYTTYDKVSGRVTATISADESITGTVEDTFKAIPGGQVFTVKTTFTTRPPG